MRRSAGLAASLFLTALALTACGHGGVIGSGPLPTPTPIVPKITNEFTVPTANSQPGGLALGADNYLYFTEQAAGKIGQMSTGGAFKEYTIASIGGSTGNNPIDITSGPSGLLWFTEQGVAPGIASMPTGGASVKEYHIAGSAPTAITKGPAQDTLAFADPGHNAIGLLLTTAQYVPYGTSTVPTGTVVAPPNCVVNAPPSSYCEFTIPTANANPVGIAVNNSDQNIYFTEHDASKIGRLDTTSGTITEIPTATANAGPTQIVEGQDGAMWFTENNVAKLGRLTTTGSAATEYPLAPATSATALLLGADNNFYFGDPASNKIGSISGINPATVSEYDIPTAGATPGKMVLGPDGLIYFTEVAGNKIAQFRY